MNREDLENKKYIKSPLNYIGGKHKILPQIIPLMPKEIDLFFYKKESCLIEQNKIYNVDCFEGMKSLADNSIDMTLTDIPYGEVNRKSNGLRNLNKEDADTETFNIKDFLCEVYRVTKNSICIFCGREQFSDIYKFFANKKGTVRPIVWEKTNPNPMN